MSKLIHEELSEDIIGSAMAVLNELKPGLDEKLYERALVVELDQRGRTLNQQKRFSVHDKGHESGTLIPDLIVDDLVIVDTKVVAAFSETHVAQMIGYLSLTGLSLGLLINFKHAKLQWNRIAK